VVIRIKLLSSLGIIMIIGLLMIVAYQNPFYANFIASMLFMAGLAEAYNIIGGFAGQLSLGHSAFFGVGAYVSVIMFVRLGILPAIGCIAGMFAASLLGAGIGYVTLRLKGPFFSLATIAFAEVLRILAINLRSVTGGSVGIMIPLKTGFVNLMFKERISYALVAGGYALLVLFISYILRSSRMGYYLLAIREDQDAAESVGINSPAWKVLAAIISAALTGLGGVLYAYWILFIEPYSEFSFEVSVNMALITMIGGMGTVYGPFFGALMLVPLQEILRGLLGKYTPGLHMLVYAVLLIMVVSFLPDGIAGLARRKLMFGKFREILENVNTKRE